MVINPEADTLFLYVENCIVCEKSLLGHGCFSGHLADALGDRVIAGWHTGCESKLPGYGPAGYLGPWKSKYGARMR